MKFTTMKNSLSFINTNNISKLTKNTLVYDWEVTQPNNSQTLRLAASHAKIHNTRKLQVFAQIVLLEKSVGRLQSSHMKIIYFTESTVFFKLEITENM